MSHESDRLERLTSAALTGIMSHGGLVQHGAEAAARLAVAAARAALAEIDRDRPLEHVVEQLSEHAEEADKPTTPKPPMQRRR